jgi:HEAT repeat protein
MFRCLAVCLSALLLATLAGCQCGSMPWSSTSKQEAMDPTTRQLHKLCVDLKANDAEVRREAAVDMREIPTADRKFVRDCLSDALRDPDHQVRQEAAETLRSFGSPDALAVLKKAACSGYQEAREQYAQATNNLRQQANKGDAQAINTLDKLGEKRVNT